MRRSNNKTAVTLNNLDVKKLHEMICAFLELVDDFILMIEDEDYRLCFDQSNELKLGSNKSKPRSSKIESLIFSDYAHNIEKMKLLVEKYPIAYNCLDEEQRLIFKSIYYDRLTDNQIMDRYPSMYSDKIHRILKDSIIIFSLKSGLYKFLRDFSSL